MAVEAMKPYAPNESWWQRTYPHRLFLVVVISLTCCLCAALSGAEYGADWRPLRPEQVPALPSGHWVMAEVTAYCPNCPICGTTGVTANGTRTMSVPYGLAASSQLPMASRVFIPAGLGVLDRVRASDRFWQIDDRGGLVEAEAQRFGILRLDVRMKLHASAVLFGRRTIPVFIINH